jgi:hypothetical protein
VRILIGDGMARISSRQQNHNNMPEETLRESGRGAFGITVGKMSFLGNIPTIRTPV